MGNEVPHPLKKTRNNPWGHIGAIQLALLTYYLGISY